MKTEKKIPLQPNGERYDYVALALAGNDELEQVMRMGVMPDLDSLADWEFKGYNTADITSLLGIRKFKKGFYVDDPELVPAQGLAGYNVKVIQNNLGDPWMDRIKKGQSCKYAFYRVYPVRLEERDNKYPNGQIINYGRGKNFVLDPANTLRDYLVQVYKDNPDLYLGKAYNAIGPLRVFASFFVLERYNRATI